MKQKIKDFFNKLKCKDSNPDDYSIQRWLYNIYIILYLFCLSSFILLFLIFMSLIGGFNL